MQAHGFRGIAVHRHDAPLTREVCEAALLFGVPVVYDVMGDLAPMEVIAEEYPAVDFILPHLGNVGGDGQAERALLDLLEHKPNVYADTAGTQRFDFLEEAIARAGASKVLFGSGGPLLHPGLELAKILLLKLKPEDQRRVVGGNLLRLISGRSVRREHGLDAIATPRPVRIGDVASEADASSTQESGPPKRPRSRPRWSPRWHLCSSRMSRSPWSRRRHPRSSRTSRSPWSRRRRPRSIEDEPLSVVAAQAPAHEAVALAPEPVRAETKDTSLAPDGGAIPLHVQTKAAATAPDPGSPARSGVPAPTQDTSPHERGQLEAPPPSPAATVTPLEVQGLESCAREPSMNLQREPDRGAPGRPEDGDPTADAHPSSGEGLAPASTTPPAILDAWASAGTVTTSLPVQLATFVVAEDAASSSDRVAEAGASITSTAVLAAARPDSISASLSELVEAASFDSDAITSPLPGPVESAAPGP